MFSNYFNTVTANFLQRFLSYIPTFLSGLILLLIGIVLANIVRRILISVLRFLNLSDVLQKWHLMQKKDVSTWENILAEVVRWVIILVFLIPTLQTWGLTSVTPVLNQFLLYLPNIIVAIIIGFAGLVVASLLSESAKSTSKTLHVSKTHTIPAFVKGVVIFFTVLIILNQLGIAPDLIRILFTGIVAMLALAGGLAFGLGGQGVAKELLEDLRDKLKEQ